MTYENIIVDTKGAVGIITLNRPQALNALSAALVKDLGAALDAFEMRNGFIAARGARIEGIRFSAAFVRDFDYYTGFVFEAHDPVTPGAKTALAGGRYDGLARRLGAVSDIPRSEERRVERV